MSADLLRRAAAVLRQHAEQAVDPLTEGAPWTVEYWPAVLDDDQPDLTVIARRNNLCSYITGVALTDSHTRYNQHLGGVEAHTEHMFEELLALARVILREQP